MKNYLLILFVSFLVNLAYAQDEDGYDDYDRFYLSYSNRLFDKASNTKFITALKKTGKEWQESDIEPTEENTVRRWQDKIDGKKHTIIIGQKTIILDKQEISWGAVKLFPGEPEYDEDFGIFIPLIDIYFSKSYACLEASFPPSAGGQAFFVYLLKLDSSQTTRIYRLPSLWNSCLDIRIEPDNSLRFFKLDYWYLPGKYKSPDPDAAQIFQPQGIIFNEYQLKNDEFEKTNKKLFAKFLDPYDVYHFSMIPALPKDAIVSD
jgi:hypothetical protein